MYVSFVAKNCVLEPLHALPTPGVVLNNHFWIAFIVSKWIWCMGSVSQSERMHGHRPYNCRPFAVYIYNLSSVRIKCKTYSLELNS